MTLIESANTASILHMVSQKNKGMNGHIPIGADMQTESAIYIFQEDMWAENHHILQCQLDHVFSLKWKDKNMNEVLIQVVLFILGIVCGIYVCEDKR